MLLPGLLDVQFVWANQYHHPKGYVFSRVMNVPHSGTLAGGIRLVHSGHVDFGINQRHWQVHGGSIMFFPPAASAAELRTVRVALDSHLSVLYFRLHTFGSIELTRQLIDAEVWRPEPARFHTLSLLVQTLLATDETPTVDSALVRYGLMHAIVGLCWEALHTDRLREHGDTQLPPWLSLVLVDLQRHPGVSVEEMARVSGYSYSQFFRLFQQYVGVSPKTYQQRCRVNQARLLLSTTDMTVTEVATHLGFTNASVFTRFFREMGYPPPAEYRRASAQEFLPLVYPPSAIAPRAPGDFPTDLSGVIEENV